MEFLDHSIHKIAFKAFSMKKIYWFYRISGFFRGYPIFVLFTIVVDQRKKESR